MTLAAELAPNHVTDLGCGTGVFAVDAANQGHSATGIDPAQTILDIARSRPGGDQVTWIHGTASAAPTASTDLVVMMGHVAQYFVDDNEWRQTLTEVHRALRPGGSVTFEVRNPRVDWASRWTQSASQRTLPHPQGDTFTSWVEVVASHGTPDSYTQTHEGHSVLPDGRHLVSSETLRFRSFDEVRTAVSDAGFRIEREWGDWDGSPVAASSPELIVRATRQNSNG